MSQDSKTTIQERIQASKVKTENAARKKRVARVPSVGGPSKTINVGLHPGSMSTGRAVSIKSSCAMGCLEAGYALQCWRQENFRQRGKPHRKETKGGEKEVGWRLCLPESHKFWQPPVLRWGEKIAKVAAGMVSSNMKSGPRKVRIEMAGQHHEYSQQDDGQPEQVTEKKITSH